MWRSSWRLGLLAVLIALVGCAVARANGTSPEPTPPVILGDVSGDQKINLADAILVLRFSLKQAVPTATQLSSADVDGDGRVTLADAMLVLRYALGLIHSFPAGPQPVPDLGPLASLHGRLPFPADNPWNQPIDQAEVDPKSDVLIASIGLTAKLHPDFGSNLDGATFGLPYAIVPGTTPPVPLVFDYDTESDPGPYPVPLDAPIEDGPDSSGDRHVLVVDRDHWKLYELFSAYPDGQGGWAAISGAVFDLSSNDLRPEGWTSADAAGLPIFPGLVRYDEVGELGEIRHALRFTAKRTRHAYINPARHYASTSRDTSLPPMGMRVRLKASFDISGFPPRCQVILRALKTYGMFLADNGGNWFLSGTPDPRWDDEEMNLLKGVLGSDFEVVKMGPLTTD
jgi:hypothetical protein